MASVGAANGPLLLLPTAQASSGATALTSPRPDRTPLPLGTATRRHTVPSQCRIRVSPADTSPVAPAAQISPAEVAARARRLPVTPAGTATSVQVAPSQCTIQGVCMLPGAR